MPHITPFLWFDTEAEEATNLYVSLFPNSKITGLARYPEGSPGQAGSVMTVEFELDGKPFTALNGGPHFKFNEAVSFVVHCKDQAEVDHYWDGLLANGGEPSQCGWLKDRYGLSWQITPDRLLELTTGPDKARAQRVFAAMMKMVKIDIAALEAAAEAR
jgi:predicted 3-demethylubiquinone-9 3-methyltransferase (glyoxalase superfamily)